MSSTLHSGPAPTGYWASELQRYLARSPALLGVLVALIGFILAGGGAYLAALGGSRYYVLVGAILLAAGYLMIKGRIAGFYAYVGAFALTSIWTFWEVGLSGWQLIPRLVGPFVLLVLAILVAPALDQTTGRRARKLGLVGVGIFVAALAILIPTPISTRHRANYQTREQTLSSKIPRMRPRRVSGAPMAAARARSGIRSSPKSRPKTSRTSSASGPSTRATFRRSTDRS
jgi:glucose dehydrogenase